MNKRFVGKKAEPTEEELEFIYSCLERLSDREVLEEMQDTEFPLRSLGFIKRRRREFRAAKRVLEDNLKTQIDPALFAPAEITLTLQYLAQLLKQSDCVVSI